MLLKIWLDLNPQIVCTNSQGTSSHINTKTQTHTASQIRNSTNNFSWALFTTGKSLLQIPSSMSVFVCLCMCVSVCMQAHVSKSSYFYPDRSKCLFFLADYPLEELCVWGIPRWKRPLILCHAAVRVCLCMCVHVCVLCRNLTSNFNSGCSCTNIALIGGFRRCTNAWWDLASQNNITPTMSNSLCVVSL